MDKTTSNRSPPQRRNTSVWVSY